MSILSSTFVLLIIFIQSIDFACAYISVHSCDRSTDRICHTKCSDCHLRGRSHLILRGACTWRYAYHIMPFKLCHRFLDETFSIILSREPRYLQFTWRLKCLCKTLCAGPIFDIIFYIYSNIFSLTKHI